MSDLETVHSICDDGDGIIPKKIISIKEAQTADIEMAVLVQVFINQEYISSKNVIGKFD